jgi:NTP pyrophosphatase (non-canonical NTP hydrolase)
MSNTIIDRHDFNELTEAQAEVLALLAEECAEVIQVVGKILRHGLESKHPADLDGPTNRGLLVKELGDLRAAIWLLAKYRLVDHQGINDAASRKADKVEQYLHHATTMGLI